MPEIPETATADDGLPAGNLRSQYRNLYERYWPQLKDYLLSAERQDLKLSKPYMVNPPDGYLGQKTRLFVVGQQTDGWATRQLSWSEDTVTSERAVSIDSLMDFYLRWLRG